MAIALPWLEIMAPERTAHAKAPPAKHFVTVVTPGGTVLDAWRPVNFIDEHHFELGPILAALAPYQQRVLGFTGVDFALWKFLNGEQTQSGIVGWLTGLAQPGAGKFPMGPSIDQVLAPPLSKGLARASLQLGVRWGTGKSHGLPHPISRATRAR